MEPLLIVLIPGLFGGLVLSWLIARNRSTTPPTFVPRRLAAPSPSLINMSSIKVEGLGGLGMVAAVVAVAIADSRIRLAMIIALILGGGLALGLIAMRARRERSGCDPVDRSMLHLERTEDAGGNGVHNEGTKSTGTNEGDAPGRPGLSITATGRPGASSPFVFVNFVSSL